VSGAGDDDVIEKRNTHDARGFLHANREAPILFARRRIAARVIVNEHERARARAERDAQRIGERNRKPVEASGGNASRRTEPVPTVEGEYPKLLVIERQEARAPCGDRERVWERRCRTGRELAGYAKAELDRGFEAKTRADAEPVESGIDGEERQASFRDDGTEDCGQGIDAPIALKDSGDELERGELAWNHGDEGTFCGHGAPVSSVRAARDARNSRDKSMLGPSVDNRRLSADRGEWPPKEPGMAAARLSSMVRFIVPSTLARFAALAALALPACSGPAAEEEVAQDDGELRTRAPAYFVQAVLTDTPLELYDKLTVTPSVVSQGAKLTGPGIFGIVCTHVAGDEACTLNWVQRREDASRQFILSGPVAKSIALALPANDRTYQNGDVGFRCDIQKGGLLSSDIYTCSFSGLTPTVKLVSGKVNVTAAVELSESDAQSAIDKYFPTM
jgi:hypothetical protein